MEASFNTPEAKQLLNDYSRSLLNLVESAPVGRCTYVTVGADREIKHRYIGEAGAVKVPVCSAVGGIEDATITASVEMAGICRIDHECVHRNIGNRIRAAAINRRPGDRASARRIEISRLPNVPPRDGVAVEDNV